jgi:hypothetical protein
VNPRIRAGMPPPAILHACDQTPAEEVLICTYTADPSFFEATCLPTARRAMRARVTVVRDAAASLPPEPGGQAGIDWTDVPVRCRNNRAFHPKLLVIAGTDNALVAVGSGNMTTSGWHHNGELWTVSAATADDWPDTFHSVAAWLRRLPEIIIVDPFAVRRLQAVAGLLDAHPAVTTGPALLHNLDTPLIDQLPPPTEPVREVVIASPYLDRRATALNAVTNHFQPQTITYVMTPNARGEATALTDWASRPHHRIHRPTGRRYLHGKLVEWATAETRWALTGSTNVTRPALLDTATADGNCELDLLCETTGTLAPELEREPLDTTEIADAISEPEPDTDRDEPGPRLLRVLADADRTDVWLAGLPDPATTADLIVSGQTPPFPLTPSPADDGLTAYTATATITPGAACLVRLPDGTDIGPVPATGRIHVQQRPGLGSPLDHTPIQRILTDPALAQRLMDLLLELAALRPDQAGINSWQTRGDLLFGPGLLRFTLGGRSTAPHPAALTGPDRPETTDPEPETEPENNEDDDDVDPDVETLLWFEDHVDRRCSDLEGWNTPSLLALLRLFFELLGTGVPWYHGTWPDTLDNILTRLTPEPAWGADTEAARQAGVLTGLALLHDAWEEIITNYDPSHPHWPQFAGIGRLLDERRTGSALTPDEINPDLVEAYTAPLTERFGDHLQPANVLELAEWLGATPLEFLVSQIRPSFPGLDLAAVDATTVSVTGPKDADPWTVTMRVLDECKELAPVTVHSRFDSRLLSAAWLPGKRLLVQERIGPVERGAEYRVAVAPAAHLRHRPPNRLRNWNGAPPDDIREYLR